MFWEEQNKLRGSKYKPANLTVYGGRGFQPYYQANEEHNRLGELLPSALVSVSGTVGRYSTRRLQPLPQTHLFPCGGTIKAR